jgi:hypothetical protein
MVTGCVELSLGVSTETVNEPGDPSVNDVDAGEVNVHVVTVAFGAAPTGGAVNATGTTVLDAIRTPTSTARNGVPIGRRRVNELSCKWSLFNMPLLIRCS